MAADSRSPRDGKHLETLGYYNPLPGQDGGKRMGLNFDRMKQKSGEYNALKVGSELSDILMNKASQTSSGSPPMRTSNPLIQDACFQQRRSHDTS